MAKKKLEILGKIEEYQPVHLNEKIRKVTRKTEFFL